MANQENKTEKPITQKEKLAKALLEIRPGVSTQDRNECAVAINKSRRTVDTYVNGHVHDIGTGFDILMFFRSKIDHRLSKMKDIVI